jgi:ribokinase
MAQETSSQRIWPYVLPFPLDTEKRGSIWSILQSRVGLKILKTMNIEERTYQHDLIQQLPYSNKSIIEYLKKMVRAAVLEEGMRTSTERGRTVWVKWYKPTSLGKWLVLFLRTPEEVPPSLTKTIIKELFHLYSSSVVEVCQRYGMDIDSFHQDLDKQYLLETAKTQTPLEVDVAVFGSVALDIYGTLRKLPASDEVVYVQEMGRHPGGMGANVAVALSRLDIPVAFFGKVGSDSTSRVLLENLTKNHVDVSNVWLAEASSLQTLILSDNQGHRWLFAVGSPRSAISLTSPDEVNWKLLDRCKIVYIGEVFVEVASSIADYAKAREKRVLYRPGTPYMRFGVENLRRVLESTTTFILNQAGWKQLQEASKVKLKSPADLLDYGSESIILTKGIDGCEIFSANKHREFSVAPWLHDKFKAVDPTGAGDGFSAGLIKSLLGNRSVEKAVEYAQVAASITCSRVGTSSAFPSREEVETAMRSRR